MMPRKYAQLKTYSKIMKYKRQTGEVKEINLPQQPEHSEYKIEEEPNVEEINESDYEDEFEDQYEDEWVDEESQQNSQRDEEQGTMQTQQQPIRQQNQQKAQVYLGTNKNLKKGQVLEFDNNAYDMLHRLNIEWPSLSIDFVCRSSPFETDALLFKEMKDYPYEVCTVQGSSNNTYNNTIYLTKWRKLHKTKYDDDPQNDGDSQDEGVANDEEPQVVVQQVETNYGVNRIRSLINSPIVAFWNQKAQVHIVDLTKNYQKLANNVHSHKRDKPKEIVLQSQCEGFALNWNPNKIGQLATGNCLGEVQIFENDETFTSWKKVAQYNSHKGSVEDIVFSPNQAHIFASCSSDKHLQIVDMRSSSSKPEIVVKAHESDINVCDWNAIASHFIVTGSDDCKVKVWDLRKISKKKSQDEFLWFSWHNEPITSVRFQPNEESVIAVASEDNSVSIWDMSVENEEQDPQIPNELMFIHQGQEEIKEICFHPIYYQMIVSSANDGINIFKPSFEMPPVESDDFKDDLKKEPIKEEDLDLYLQKMSLN